MQKSVNASVVFLKQFYRNPLFCNRILRPSVYLARPNYLQQRFITSSSSFTKMVYHGILDDVVPDVISNQRIFRYGKPSVILHVKYGNRPVNSGDTLTFEQTQKPPDIHFDIPSSNDPMYVLIMTDPDAPSRMTPTFREWCHWIRTFTPTDCNMQTHDILSYFGPAPPPGSGLHRYVFLLFASETKDVKFVQIPNGRKDFKSIQWAEMHHLKLLGSQYFKVKRE